MKALRRLFARVMKAATRGRGDERLREEMEAHLAMATEENLRAGMAPGQARREARLKFGAVEAVRAQYRAEESLPWAENLLMDARYALRVLWKAPSFTAVAVVTLTLGIGANVVVFGVLNAVLLQPLAVRAPQNLYQVRNKPWRSGRLLTTSYPAFEDFRRRNRTFSDMAALYGYSSAGMRWKSRAVRALAGVEVTGNYFDMLGVEPAVGRVFHAADERGPGSAPWVVLSDALWRSAFGADPGVVGTTVDMNRHPFTVIGVAPAAFHGTERFVWPDYWIPMVDEEEIKGEDYLQSRTSRLTVIGRLRPGATAAEATDDLNAIAAELAKEYPQTDKGVGLRLVHPGLFGDEGDVIRGFLVGVTVLAGLVLAAACANLASLFGARAADRSRELALRVALGSSRGRVVGQLLLEALLVSLMGGAAGLMGAEVLLRALDQWHPAVGHLAVAVDRRVYLAGLLFTLGSALLFGLVPARQAWRSSPLGAMKSGPLESVPVRRFALRDLLLGGQIAVCTLLVTASLVAVRGMVRALHAPLGIEPEGVTLAEMDLSQVGQDGDVALAKQKAMLEAVRGLPGVSAAAAINATPMGGGSKGIPIFREGTTEFTLDRAVLETRLYDMSPGYFEATGTRLLGGRDVSWQDAANTPAVAIVNETFARKMWGETPAVGQRFVLDGRRTEVVGVVEDGKYHDLAESPEPAAFFPLSQAGSSDAVFLVRSRLGSDEMGAALRRTLSGIEPEVPLRVESWPEALEDVLFPAKAATVALGILGVLAAMLAVTGIFGMAAYNVSRRLKELGIRVALGARRTQVMEAAVGRPLVLLGMGSMLGLGMGVFTNGLLQRMVYGAEPGAPAVLGGAVLTMAVLGMAATAIPAYRALGVDASRLMREE